MIVKIMNKNEIEIYSDIDSISTTRDKANRRFLNCYKDKESIYLIPLTREPFFDEIESGRFVKEDRPYIYDCAYLMNDKGQTIERII